MKNFNPFKRKQELEYNKLITKEQPLSYASEEYQKAIINFEYVNVDNNYKAIQFTSALLGEGKTTTLSNFAYLLAQTKKVLVIDLDLRRPKLHRVFDVANEDGLNDYLLDKITLDKAIRHNKDLNVDYLLSGEKTTAIINILTAEKLETLFKELREVYDYILVDSPPVLPVSDSLSIAKLVDGIIFINGSGKANKKRILDAFNSLKITGTPIIGTMMTQVPMKKGSRSQANYYYYYE